MIWLAHLPSGDLLHSELEAMTQLDDFPRNLHLLMDFHSYVKYLNHQMLFFLYLHLFKDFFAFCAWRRCEAFRSDSEGGLET
jgi:hypothetical protein